MLVMQFPELADLDRGRSPGQWDAVLRRFRTELRRLAGSDGGKPRFAEWFPKDTAPEDPAAKSPDLPAVRKFVAAAKGLSAEQVEALRIYAAAHEGKLPDKLDEITEVPVPFDPGTGKPFEYSRAYDTATLTGPTNGPTWTGRPTSNGVRYRASIRKK